MPIYGARMTSTPPEPGAYPPAIPPANRSDPTPQAVEHANDHNLSAVALAAILGQLGDDPSGTYGDLTERLAAITTAVADASEAAASVPANAVTGNVPGVKLILSDTDPGALGPTEVWVALTGTAGTASTVRVADLPRPLVIPSKGAGAALAPENTRAAFRIGASYGLGVVDGGDWRTTSDGALACIADSTLDRTTPATGNVSDATASQMASLLADAGAWFGGGFGDELMASADEMFSIYGSSAVLAPEPKTQAAATALADLIRRQGLQQAVLPNTSTIAYLAAFRAVGCTELLLRITSMPDAATMQTYRDAGVTWLGIPYNGTLTPANVTALADAGFEVLVSTEGSGRAVNRQADVTPWATVYDRISGWEADEPLYALAPLGATYAARYRRTKDPFTSGRYYHGHIASVAATPDLKPVRRGTFKDGRWGFLSWDGTVANAWALQGWNCPIPNPAADYTIALNVTFDALGTDVARWAGIFTAQPTDARFADVNLSSETGYMIRMRVDGRLEVLKKTAGVAGTAVVTQTTAISAPLTLSAALTSGAAITALPVTAIPSALAVGALLMLPTGQTARVATAAAAGATSVTIDSLTPSAAVASGTSLPQTVPLTVAHTATAVTITRTDTAQSAALTGLTDAATRGGYWFLGESATNQTTGLWVTFSKITSV